MMRRFFFITILTLLVCQTQAQTIQCDIDSVNNEMLLTSNYMSYSTKGVRHTKKDERLSVSLNFFSTPTDAYYILCMPVVSDEVMTIKKGSKLKLMIQPKDTVILKCSTDFTSKDRFHEGDSALWVVLPKYHCTEKTLRRLLDNKNKVQEIFQELPDGKWVKLYGQTFYRWKFTQTLESIYKEINKMKPKNKGADMLYNRGQYEYVKNDSVISTDKKIKFSDKWLY